MFSLFSTNNSELKNQELKNQSVNVQNKDINIQNKIVLSSKDNEIHNFVKYIVDTQKGISKIEIHKDPNNNLWNIEGYY